MQKLPMILDAFKQKARADLETQQDNSQMKLF
jgi:hypothetical protein